LRVVEPIDRRAIPAGHEMPIDIDRYLNRAVPHLLLHVRETLPLLDEQRGKRDGEGPRGVWPSLLGL